MKLKGKVILKKFGKGTKSEHDAVYFQTGKGEFVLRELGANAFQNDSLKALVGRELELSGMIEGSSFLLPNNSLAEKQKKTKKKS